jgi:dipeptidyl aminopeptidase/acylaminoacyl peptidase
MLDWVVSPTRGNNDAALRYWKRFMGLESAKDPAANEISPVAHIDNLNVPFMLIHGENDVVVPYSQSTIMQKALQRAGKPIEFVTMKKGDHWLTTSENRTLLLEASISFLKKNNPPD